VQSTELTDACNKLPPDLFGMPFCQLIRWFASPMDRTKPGLLSKLFSPSNTGYVLVYIFLDTSSITIWSLNFGLLAMYSGMLLSVRT